MGFYLRKSFGFGPVRLNLSKSGLGASLGVKGLRIGTGPRGAYLHAGREGLYFRRGLTSSAPAEDMSPSNSRPNPDALNDYDTVMWGALLLGAAFAIVGFVQAQPRVASGLNGLAAISFLLGVILFWHRSRRLRQRAQFAEQQQREAAQRQQVMSQYQAALEQIAKGEDAAELQNIRQLRANPFFSRTAFSEEEQRTYWHALGWDLKQRTQASAPRAWAAQVAKALSLDTRVAFEIRRAYYRTVWHSALEDETLEVKEEIGLQMFQDLLELSDEDLRDERAILAEYRQARTIATADPLPMVEADIPLQKGESCHHRTEGELLDKRIAREYQQDGRRHVQHRWVATKAGRCYITSKRILIVGQGTATIPHGKVLDLEVDADEKIIEITKDGRQEPIYLRVPDPIVTGALLERLQSQRDDTEEIE